MKKNKNPDESIKIRIILILIFFLILFFNCNYTGSKLDKNERNTLLYFVTEANKSSDLLNSQTEIYPTIFSNNCKNNSTSILERKELASIKSTLIDDMFFLENEFSELKENKSANKNGCNNLWDGGVIPYEINPEFSNVSDLYEAFSAWERKSVIRFVKKTNLHKNYIYITPSTGCSSYIGKIGGAQNINLSDDCSFNNILHELGHAIGFYHEHQRMDRDEFIVINKENIIYDKLRNFDKLFPDYLFSKNYDILSIMHYDFYAFSANSKPSITPRKNIVNVGTSGILSELDVSTANALYANNFKVINNIPVGYYR